MFYQPLIISLLFSPYLFSSSPLDSTPQLTETFYQTSGLDTNIFKLMDMKIKYNQPEGHIITLSVEWVTGATALVDPVKVLFKIPGKGEAGPHTYDLADYCGKEGIGPPKTSYTCIIPKPESMGGKKGKEKDEVVLNRFLNTMNVDDFAVEMTSLDGKPIYSADIKENNTPI